VSIEGVSTEGSTNIYEITYNDGTTQRIEVEKLNYHVDTELSETSVNPVENRVVTGKFGEIDEDIAEINQQASTLQTDVTRLSVEVGNMHEEIENMSAPIFVDSTSQMTDNSRVYVLKSTGDIYYYNGTQFVSSGIKYGSGTGCVSSFNHLISTGTYESLGITSFDDLEKNMIYAYNGNETEYISNVPDYRYNGFLIDFAYNQNSNTGRLQLFSNRYRVWIRTIWNDEWTTWKPVNPSSEIYITHENASVYSDVRDLPTNSVYAISDNVASVDVLNLPTYGHAGVLYKTNMDNGGDSINGEILLYVSTGRMYYQLHFGTSYQDWVKLDNTFPYVITSNNTQGYSSYDEFESGSYVIADSESVLLNPPTESGTLGFLISHDIGVGGMQMFYQGNFNTTINCRMYIRYKWNSTWSTWYPLASNGYNIYSADALTNNNLPTDLNNYKSKITLAISSAITSDILANLPVYGVSGLLTVENFSEISLNGVTQTYITSDNTIWVRLFYGNSWHDWVGMTETGSNYFINTCVDKPFNLDANSKILAFGDSITAGYNVGANNVWVKLISDKLGCALENKAVSGARFDETVSNSIKAQYESVTDWTGVTHVFIAGGVNDASNDTNIALFKGYVQNAIDYIKANTNAKILFVTPIERINTTHNTIHYSSIINSLALKNDCSVINGYDVPIPFKDSQYYENMTSDGLHPTILGQKVYARYVLGQLL
jgi:lysophospholipase L1-like esterase